MAECCIRQLNQVSLVLLYFRLSALSDLYWVCLSVFSCTVLCVSISQVIGCEDRLRNDLYCVSWGVKLYSNQTKGISLTAPAVEVCLGVYLLLRPALTAGHSERTKIHVLTPLRDERTEKDWFCVIWRSFVWFSFFQHRAKWLDFTEARDSEWQWHQLGHMQVCTSLQTDNHTSTPPLSFLQAGCPSCLPTNSVKALKANANIKH